MKRKKILFLSQMFPYPPVSGGLIKTLNTLKALSKRYEIHAVFITDALPPPQALTRFKSMGIHVTYFVSKQIRASLKEKFWEVLACYLRGIPFYVYQYTHKSVFEYVLQTIERVMPDIIHVDHLNLSQYLPKIKYQTWILEHHNVESYLYWTRLLQARKMTRVLYLLIETALTYRYERFMIKKFDHVFAISKPEEARIRSMFGVENVSTQPLSYTEPRIYPKSHKGKNILFVGVLDWPPNEDAIQWFVNDILPIVVQKIPEVHFHLVGRLGPRYVPKSTDHVTVHGFQKYLTQFLSEADVFVLPFRMGGGLRLKALTALSSGVPVVTTPLGVEGLEVTSGIECLIAKTSESFAHAVVRILEDDFLRKKLRQHAIRYMRDAHGEKNNGQFLSMYRMVTQRYG